MINTSDFKDYIEWKAGFCNETSRFHIPILCKLTPSQPSQTVWILLATSLIPWNVQLENYLSCFYYLESKDWHLHNLILNLLVPLSGLISNVTDFKRKLSNSLDNFILCVPFLSQFEAMLNTYINSTFTHPWLFILIFSHDFPSLWKQPSLLICCLNKDLGVMLEEIASAPALQRLEIWLSSWKAVWKWKVHT